MQGAEINGREIKIDFAQEKEESAE